METQIIGFQEERNIYTSITYYKYSLFGIVCKPDVFQEIIRIHFLFNVNNLLADQFDMVALQYKLPCIKEIISFPGKKRAMWCIVSLRSPC